MPLNPDSAPSSTDAFLPSIADLARIGLIEPYVRAVLLAEQAATITLTPEQDAQAQQAFCQQEQIRDAAALQAYATARLLTPQALEARMRQPLQLHLLAQRQFAPKAEARFLQRKSQLDRVVYSLLRLRDAGLARELYLRIQEGEANFADLAAEFAEGPEQATRGIVGPVPLTQAHPLLVDRLRTALPGSVLEPFPIESWWLVVRLESMTPASFDEATAARMTNELFEQSIAEEVDRRLERFRSLLALDHSPEDDLQKQISNAAASSS
jgi:parvulin-like peptidyl-prolyl isomerase